jgi:hypothetical protein
MSTNSTIAIQKLDGSIEQIYCHWDGYLEHNGTILKTHYKTPAEVKRLISYGDLSSLGTRVEPINDYHSFSTPETDTCVYYGRDRGEPDTFPRKFEDMTWFRLNGQREEYNYLYVESEQHWYLVAKFVGRDLELLEFLKGLDEVKTKQKPENLMDFIEFYKDKVEGYRSMGANSEAAVLNEVITDLEKILGF